MYYCLEISEFSYIHCGYKQEELNKIIPRMLHTILLLDSFSCLTCVLFTENV